MIDESLQTTDSTLSVPVVYWNMLPKCDQDEYIMLKNTFQRFSARDHKGSSFRSDLQQIFRYIERRSDRQEIRSIVCGICKFGNVLCVNTNQLKKLMGRCKSSINNGFQIIGFSTSKEKVKQSITSILPTLSKDSSLIRQWTIRCSENVPVTPHIIKSVQVQIAPPIIPKPLPTPIINMQRFNNESESYITYSPIARSQSSPSGLFIEEFEPLSMFDVSINNDNYGFDDPKLLSIDDDSFPRIGVSLIHDDNKELFYSGVDSYQQ